MPFERVEVMNLVPNLSVKRSAHDTLREWGNNLRHQDESLGRVGII